MLYKSKEIDWPLDKNMIRRSSESHTFGMVRRDTKNNPKAHQGWDFYAPEGTACYAVANGSVAYAGDRGDLGNVIILACKGMGVFAVYAHLSDILVKRGDQVTIGQVIGFTGTTGNASKLTGLDQHLHFEIRTVPFPGYGLTGRISPLAVFGKYPLTRIFTRERFDKAL